MRHIIHFHKRNLVWHFQYVVSCAVLCICNGFMNTWESVCVSMCVSAGWHLLSHFLLICTFPGSCWRRVWTCDDLFCFLCSVLNRTPVHLIHEIILVDDFSNNGESQTQLAGFFQVRSNRDETYEAGQMEKYVLSSWVFRLGIKLC